MNINLQEQLYNNSKVFKENLKLITDSIIENTWKEEIRPKRMKETIDEITRELYTGQCEIIIEQDEDKVSSIPNTIELTINNDTNTITDKNLTLKEDSEIDSDNKESPLIKLSEQLSSDKNELEKAMAEAEKINKLNIEMKKNNANMTQSLTFDFKQKERKASEILGKLDRKNEIIIKEDKIEDKIMIIDIENECDNKKKKEEILDQKQDKSTIDLSKDKRKGKSMRIIRRMSFNISSLQSKSQSDNSEETPKPSVTNYQTTRRNSTKMNGLFNKKSKNKINKIFHLKSNTDQFSKSIDLPWRINQKDKNNILFTAGLNMATKTQNKNGYDKIKKNKDLNDKIYKFASIKKNVKLTNYPKYNAYKRI